MRDKVAIITGGSSGLGAAVAENFGAAGAKVVIAGRNLQKATAVQDELRAKGYQVDAQQADVASRDSAHALVNGTVEKYGAVHIVVSSAGITRYTPFLETTEADWNAVLGTDLCGVFFMAQAAAPHMRRQKYGKIVNISSAHGTGCTPHMTAGSPGGSCAYAAAKAGVNQLTKTLARELGPDGINVNCVAPGTFLTPIQLTTRTPEQMKEHIALRLKANVTGRLGKPEEFAEVVAFLCSDGASYMNGFTIQLDGGRTDRM